jgi:thiosulfate/3-mercaptopyruvate sulfurtransferase
MNRVLIAPALALTGILPAQAATFGPLVSPEELEAAVGSTDAIILDIRGDAYAEGHVDGAVSAPYGLFRGPADNPGQLIEAATLEERYESLGLELDRPIIIAPEGKTDTDFGAAARVYWTLKSSGFENLSILNGGVSAWEAAGYTIEDQPTVLEPTELDITFSLQWTADTDDVVAITKGEVDALLLDARTPEFYEGKKGHPKAAMPGTLPGANNQAYTAFFDQGTPALQNEIESTSLLDQLGVSSGEQIVSFCNTGHWAATNWFALSEVAGLENVKLYPGSMVEYTNAGNDVVNAPGLIGNFINKVTGG